MQYIKVNYQIATYSGSVGVFCDPETEDEECILAQAKEEVRQRFGLPEGYQRFWID